MMPMVLNPIILILGAGFLFQPSNGSPDLIAAIKKGDKSAEQLAATFDPRAVPLYYSEFGTGWNHYWGTTSNRYKVTVLDLALLYGRDNVAIILINRGADISTQGEFENTPLHIAAGRGLDTVVRELLTNIKMTNPQALDLQNKDCKTPLHFAVDYYREDVIKTLLVGGANPNIVDDFGNTPLHLAIQQNLSGQIIIDIIEAMKAKAVDILGHNEMTNPSGRSSGTMDLDRNAISEASIDEARSRIMNLKNSLGWTPFLYAVYHRREEICRILLKRGADPTITDIHDNSALHLAAQQNLSGQIIIDIIEAMKAKAVDILGHNEITNPSEYSSGTMVHDDLDPNTIGEATSEVMNLRNHKGRTAFWMAVRHERYDIANIFFQNGADPTILNYCGESPFHLMIKNINVNHVDSRGKTLFRYAFEGKREVLIKHLLERFPSGDSTFHTRLPTDMTDEMIILMIKNIDVNHVDRRGKTLLRYAFEDKREVLITHLLERFATTIVPDRDGNTALHLAIEFKLSDQIFSDIIKAASPKPIHLVLQNKMTSRFFRDLSDKLHENLPREVVRNILALSCDAIINSKRHDGQTAFCFAVSNNRVDIAKILLENGADPTIAASDGNTPLHDILLALSDDSILSMIRNIDINHLYNDGSTIFHCAIKCDREVLVIKLLKRGANPNIADADGNTALHLATLHNLSSETIISILEATTPRLADIVGQGEIHLNQQYIWKTVSKPATSFAGRITKAGRLIPKTVLEMFLPRPFL